jgi:hypothetical protein
MSRYAKANQTINDLIDKIEASDGIYNIVYESNKVYTDLSKINVDFENVESFDSEDAYTHLPGLESLYGYEMIGDGDSAFPILWCAGGGDWELPLVFVIYIGQKGELRGYIPEDGNAYNHEKKAAYGNNDGDPEYDEENPDPRYVFDVKKMRADVANRIVVKGSGV